MKDSDPKRSFHAAVSLLLKFKTLASAIATKSAELGTGTTGTREKTPRESDHGHLSKPITAFSRGGGGGGGGGTSCIH